jgi:hypothetical protein
MSQFKKPLIVDDSSETDPTVLQVSDSKVLLDYGMDEDSGEFYNIKKEVPVNDLIKCWKEHNGN